MELIDVETLSSLILYARIDTLFIKKHYFTPNKRQIKGSYIAVVGKKICFTTPSKEIISMVRVNPLFRLVYISSMA